MVDRVARFNWDNGNRAKCRKHGVSITEIESVFGPRVKIRPDVRHSHHEERFLAIGPTRLHRHAFVVFTIRQHGDHFLIRPISARYMHRKEIAHYEKENPGFPNR
ncbi:MAG: BrnT family toxin [Rhodospirillaceae bacterium]|nr:MAG: BrnT family toxin [Rhodospirillaceae bacterium]